MRYIVMFFVLAHLNVEPAWACSDLFEMPKPYFYVLKKNEKTSILLGTTHRPVPLSVLKPFVREAIASAVLVAYDSFEPYETLMKQAAQKAAEMVHTSGTRLTSRLSPEMGQWYRELARKSLDAIAIVDGHQLLSEEQFAKAFEQMDQLSPSTALSVVYGAILPLGVSTGAPPQRAAVPEPSTAPANDNPLSLHQQVILLARSKGAQSMAVEPPAYLQKALRANNTIESFEQTLRFLKYGPVVQGQKPFDYLEGDLARLEKFSETFRRHAVLSYKTNLANRVRSWMPLIQELHQSGMGVLFAFPVEQFVTPQGLLAVLRKNHFKVIRVATPEQFQKLK